MSDRINRSPIAPTSYTTDFSLEDRMRDLLRFALATERLTEDEVDLVATSLTAEAQSRHATEREWDRYWKWRADVAREQRESFKRAEREREARDNEVIARTAALRDAEQRNALSRRRWEADRGRGAEAC
jgi:hypothetical protein